ncbi:MAG: cupredoxin domain-containing protein, partial [Candidatus Limnocylindrales bacterium]
MLYVSSISAGAVYRVGPADKVGAGTSSPAPSASAGSGQVVEITVGTDPGADLKFDPASVSVPAGAHVRASFENRATVPHNLTFSEPISTATATVVAPGASETVEFTAPDPGDYAFVCTLHPGMGGTLTVTPS